MSTAVVASERRRAVRVQSSSPARVFFEQGAQFRDCTITNISTTGACLRLKDNETVPDEALLVDLDARNTYDFRVVWRLAPLVAVKFVSPLSHNSLGRPSAFN
jgi:hypothetical protein